MNSPPLVFIVIALLVLFTIVYSLPGHDVANGNVIIFGADVLHSIKSCVFTNVVLSVIVVTVCRIPVVFSSVENNVPLLDVTSCIWSNFILLDTDILLKGLIIIIDKFIVPESHRMYKFESEKDIK